MSDWKSDDIAELAKALAAAQAEIVDPLRTASNPHFGSRYAPLEATLQAVRPVLSRHGLSVTQTVAMQPGLAAESRHTVALRTVLMHSSGQWVGEESVWAVPPNIQAACSAVTYLRRYGLSSIVGVASEPDDDGHGASGPASDGRAPKPPSGPLDSQIDTILGLAGRLFPAVSMRADLIAVCRRLGLPESSRDMSESQASTLIRELERLVDAADGRAPDDQMPERAGGER